MIRYAGVLAAAFLLLFSGCKKNSAESYMQKGAENFQNQDFDGAIANYNKAIELEPKSAVAYNLLGMAYRFKFNQTRNTDYLDKQIEAFNKSIELDPSYWMATMNLGTTYYYGGQKNKAAAFFKKTLEINPDHPEKAQLEQMIKEGE